MTVEIRQKELMFINIVLKIYTMNATTHDVVLTEIVTKIKNENKNVSSLNVMQFDL